MNGNPMIRIPLLSGIGACLALSANANVPAFNVVGGGQLPSLRVTTDTTMLAMKQKDEQAVRSVVERYLHGLKFNDVSSLRSAFWPEAKLFFVKRDGSLGQLSQEEWYRGFVSSAGKEEEGDLRVATIEVVGDIASVKVVETYPKSVYVDYLSLLRLKGQWIIVNNVYTSYPR